MITSDSSRWKLNSSEHRVPYIYSSPASSSQPVSPHPSLALALCQRMGVQTGERREYIMYTIDWTSAVTMKAQRERLRIPGLTLEWVFSLLSHVFWGWNDSRLFICSMSVAVVVTANLSWAVQHYHSSSVCSMCWRVNIGFLACINLFVAASYAILIEQTGVWIKDDDARSIQDHLLATIWQTWARRTCAAAGWPAVVFGQADIFPWRIYCFWSPSLIWSSRWSVPIAGLFVVDLLAGQRSHHAVEFDETITILSHWIGHWCFEKMRRLCLCSQRSQEMHVFGYDQVVHHGCCC